MLTVGEWISSCDALQCLKSNQKLKCESIQSKLQFPYVLHVYPQQGSSSMSMRVLLNLPTNEALPVHPEWRGKRRISSKYPITLGATNARVGELIGTILFRILFLHLPCSY